ncbi:hypothetical protein CYMTET_47480 [Cymbomonas tetramitiformis]|uniref:Uncharacterized protein n=1 Tax=Cymbomonas tetramitiformis TaxID=36881 RepID=A0AAE0BW16_9CHLO|nr:hypothetical protein CYMTET_47480 [Cymbomonas tetramitiformis]
MRKHSNSELMELDDLTIRRTTSQDTGRNTYELRKLSDMHQTNSPADSIRAQDNKATAEDSRRYSSIANPTFDYDNPETLPVVQQQSSNQDLKFHDTELDEEQEVMHVEDVIIAAPFESSKVHNAEENTKQNVTETMKESSVIAVPVATSVGPSQQMVQNETSHSEGNAGKATVVDIPLESGDLDVKPNSGECNLLIMVRVFIQISQMVPACDKKLRVKPSCASGRSPLKPTPSRQSWATWQRFSWLWSTLFLESNQKFTLSVTDKRILFQELYYNKSMFFNIVKSGEHFFQASVSFPIAALAFYRLETVQGMMSKDDIVVLELHFNKYPAPIDITPSEYKSFWLRVLFPLVQMVYGIKGDPAGIMNNAADETVEAVTSFMNKIMSLIFNIKDSIIKLLGMVLSMMLYLIKFIPMWFETMEGVAESPNKVHGGSPGNVLTMRVSVADDPEALHHAIAILKALGCQHPCASDITSDSKLEVDIQVNHDSLTKESAIFSDKSKQFMFPGALIPLGPTEEFVHALDDNPSMGAFDYLSVVTSAGMYYLTDLQGHLDHTTASFLTNQRFVHVSLKAGSAGGIEHLRVLSWYLPNVKHLSLASRRNALNEASGELAFSSSLGNIIVQYGDINSVAALCRALCKGVDLTASKLMSEGRAVCPYKQIARNKVCYVLCRHFYLHACKCDYSVVLANLEMVQLTS